MMKARFTFVWLVAMLSACAVWAQKNHDYEVSKSLKLFNQLYKELDLCYVDTLQAERTINDAINYMLDRLDPYTEYFPAKEAKDFETLTTGKYAGIGSIITYSKTADRCVIKEPYEGMPAARAGLKVGDVIMSIDGNVIEKKGAAPTDEYTSRVSNALRGEANTDITIVVDRPGKGEMTFTFKRSAIQLTSVPYSGMLTDSVGYIVLTSFTKDCSREVETTFAALREKGAKSLILDLRNNGGGLAIEAVNIVNMFVPKGKTILEMRGKSKSSNSVYVTRNKPVDLQIPLVILVNGSSASSSEITCGALQDLDRAVVMGERTYGKGLVQQPRELPYGATLKVTTSHYYIPSGRCIQAYDYSRRGRGGEGYRTPDSLTHEFSTANGRKVRDGGGITPDVVFASDSMPNLLAYIQMGNELTEYIGRYQAEHPTIAAAEEFSMTDEDYEAFKKFLSESSFTYDRQTSRLLEDLKRMARLEGYIQAASAEIEALEKKLSRNLGEDLDLWKSQVVMLLNSEICRAYYYQRGAIANTLRGDKTLHEAVALLRQPERYKALLSAPAKK